MISAIRKAGMVLSKPRILHLASFVGNIGDSLSHLGLHRLTERLFGVQAQTTEVELRRTYENYRLNDRLSLDSEFVDFCNSFDFVVFGGGNLLEPFEATDSGTRLPLDLKAIDKLRVPTVFASIGMVPREKPDERTLKRQLKTLERLADHPCLEILPRNDGSVVWLNEIEPTLGERLVESLDAAFFAAPSVPLHSKAKKSIVAFNVAPDQIQSLPGVEYEQVIETISLLIMDRASATDSEFVFVPHLHQDVQAFSQICALLPDYLVRSRFSIAKSHRGIDGANLALQEYRTASEVWGMRFHSLIAGMILDKPLLPMIALDRVRFMLDSVGFVGPVIDFRLERENLPELASAYAGARAAREIINRKSEDTARRYASVFPAHSEWQF